MKLMSLVSVVLFTVVGIAKGSDESPNFTRDIRPIFSNKCFVCHGPDSNTREGGFRLDLKESAFGPADSGEIPIFPGDVEKSEVMRRVSAVGDHKMPPADSEKQLTTEEVELIRRWIDGGAKWEEHWAFQKPRKVELPPVTDSDWVHNAIDSLVLDKLDSLMLKPAPRASKSILIRRLSLDLTGLPPSINEVERFLADDSDEAYERIVDRLLSSPHFGEHFASSWLDAARFADTNGYQNDFKRSMWLWRDWVIRALNENMPFDQFTTEQIAGDLIPNASIEQKIATGFNRNHRTVTEGGSIEEEWHVENLVDRVETTSTVFLGLTMGCARCHDHKYDPISQREFYQFFAFFNSINEKGFNNERRGNVPPILKVESADYKQKLNEVSKRVEELEVSLEKLKTETRSKYPNGFQVESAESIKPMLVVAGKQNKQSIFGRSNSLVAKDHHPIALGNAFLFDGEQPFTISTWIQPKSFGAIMSRMDVENDYRGGDILINRDGTTSVHLVHRWPDDALKVTTEQRLEANKWSNVVVTYDGSKTANGIRIFFNGQQKKLRIDEDGLIGTTLTEHPLWLGLRKNTSAFVGQIANAKFFDVALDEAAVDTHMKRELVEMNRLPHHVDEPVKKEIEHLTFVGFAPEYSELNNRLERLRARKSAVQKEIPTVMVMEEADQPRTTYVLERGEYDKPITDEEILPGFPQTISNASELDRRLNRMDLAKWLVDTENPLTARVTVNRIWSQLFGIGIHRTVEDFGVQSPEPTHPELLDWLAVDFVDNGWDVKKLIKTIVMSSTYQQSSAVSPEQYSADPKNKWLSRGSRFRLPAEAIRDNALAASGLLNRKIGGKSIKPYQPAGLWDDLAGGAGEGKYVMETDDNLYRRSLYIYRKRTVPHPTMSTFDASSREVCEVVRQRTNTPLQALALLNDETYVEAARNLAIQAIQAEDSLERRLEIMFMAATSRVPKRTELEVLLRVFNDAKNDFEKNKDAAAKYVATGLATIPEQIEVAELAAYSIVGSMILNLDETITRE